MRRCSADELSVQQQVTGAHASCLPTPKPETEWAITAVRFESEVRCICVSQTTGVSLVCVTYR